jgi:8-oxo-dGTP diphosphatase
LPGGYVEDRERTRDAAVRELEEETGVRSSDLALVGVYDDPHRDPRGWTVSVAYAVNFAERTPAKGGDDAREARWFPVGALPPLAFDHGLIIDDAVTAANGAVTA